MIDAIRRPSGAFAFKEVPMKVRVYGDRKIQNVFTVKITPEKGGGESRVEMRATRSVESIYKRMMASGEIQNAAMVKSNTHGNLERAAILMADAKVAPRYMSDGEIKEIGEKMSKLDSQLKAKNAKKKRADEINVLVEERLKDERERIV